jgi:hypothetical protein
MYRWERRKGRKYVRRRRHHISVTVKQRGGEFFVVDPHPRPSRLSREVFSRLQEAIGRWIIMNTRDIPVNPYNHYSRLCQCFFFRKEVLCH